MPRKQHHEVHAHSLANWQAAPARSWVEVRDEFNRRHGTNLTRSRIHQIAKQALDKLRAALAGEEVL